VLPSTGTSALRNAISLTNTYILDNHGDTGMFATLFFAVLDPATGALAYVNGGQTPPLLICGGAIKECLQPTGPAVGILPEAEWDIRQAQMEPGDLLLAYTDGVTEARSAAGGFYGDERLRALVCGRTFAAAELADAIEEDVRAFAAGAEQSDDITLLVARRAR
jgi:sigma-B regulation protein RsbU (phosphoserine phosphatase)